jgi:hypothetical protein
LEGLKDVDVFYGHLEYFTDILDFYDHLLHFVLIWYIFSVFGIMCQEKSGNPGTGEGDEHSGNRSRNVEEESE